MPIVSEKSNLKATYQENLIEPNPTPKKPTPVLGQGVNYFTDTNAKGFILNTNGNRDTNFIIGSNTITKANVLDQKGDISIKPYTIFNKAEPIRKDLGQKAFDTNKFRGEISFPKNNKKDSRGNVTLPFNENKKFKIDGSNNSRLLNLHTTDNYLNKLYEKAKGKGILGYRNNNVFGFDQPFVIRDIGDRWGTYDSFGLGDSKFGNNIESIIKIGSGLINTVGGAVLGRTPSEYLGNAIGSLERTAKFLLTPQGLGFLTKQAILMRNNKQEVRTDVRYGIFDDPNSLANGDSYSAGNLAKTAQNPRLYNPLSLASLPGITKISILAYDPTLIAGSYLNTIGGLISQGALNLAEAVGEKIVTLGKGVLGVLGALGKKTGIKSPFKGFKTPNLKTPEALKDTAKKVDATVKKAADVVKSVSGILSKTSTQLFDANAFSEVGADRVNLIPYGDRSTAKFKDKDENQLDFIPFRFEDRNGKLIVFRAILSGITDTFSPEYASERYVGRPDNVYVYQGTQREISFTFDIMPKSDKELVVLWEKMNYLAGLTYPDWTEQSGGGQGMIAPFCKLTIGDMYKNTSGYISSLSFSVQENGTWETTFAKLPKYIQASVGFTYIGDRLPSMYQKHYELPWVGETKYETGLLSSFIGDIDSNSLTPDFIKKQVGK